MLENFINQLQTSVASISMIQWVLIAMIMITLAAAIAGLCLLVNRHPILAAVSGLIITLALPAMIEKIHLTQDSMTLTAVILIINCVIVLRICIKRGLL